MTHTAVRRRARILALGLAIGAGVGAYVALRSALPALGAGESTSIDAVWQTVLLLALGVEFNFFRRSWRDPVQRAAMIVTVTVMCAALVLALSTLPFDARECDDILAAWHEYAAFTVTLQAVFMALATVLWLMLMNLPSGESVGDGAPADRF